MKQWILCRLPSGIWLGAPPVGTREASRWSEAVETWDKPPTLHELSMTGMWSPINDSSLIHINTITINQLMNNELINIHSLIIKSIHWWLMNYPINDHKLSNQWPLHHQLITMNLIGGWYTYPSEKYEFVTWDDYSQYMEKRKMFQTTNQSWYLKQ